MLFIVKSNDICYIKQNHMSNLEVDALAKYIIKRLIIVIPTVLLLMFAVFMIIYHLPGSNRNEFTTHANGDALDGFFEKTSLHDTAVGKFIRFMDDLLIKHNPGKNAVENAHLRTIRLRLKYTFLLTFLGLLMSVIIGIPLGMASALRQGKALDKILSFISVILSALPPYILAILLVFLFSNALRLLPPQGIEDGIESFIMPAITIGAAGVALISSMTRSAVLEILDKPYISVLRANGIPKRRILFSHILRNSLFSILSSLNVIITSLLCGSLIVENFFSIPGIGQMVVTAVSGRNQCILLVSVGLVALILMVVRIFSDVLCAFVNPQVRARLTGKKVL